MRAKSLALLVLALGCGLVAAIGITQVMANRGKGAGPKKDEQTIFVAKEPIELGQEIKPELIKAEHWPKEKVPADALTKFEDMEGRRTRAKIFAGDPIVERKLWEKGVGTGGKSGEVPAGLRLATIRASAESMAGFLIRPRDRVDVMVYFSGNRGTGGGGPRMRLLLQDIKVFAIDDITNAAKEAAEGARSIKGATVTLLVTPKQHQKVTLAQKLGEIVLSLRNPGDSTTVEDAELALEDLFDKPEVGDPKVDTPDEEGPQRPESQVAESGFGDFLKNLVKGNKDDQKTVEQPVPTPPVSQPVLVQPQQPDLTHIMVVMSGGEDEQRHVFHGDKRPDGSVDRWRKADPSALAPPPAPPQEPETEQPEEDPEPVLTPEEEALLEPEKPLSEEEGEQQED